MVTFSFMLDFVLLGSKSTVQLLVFTNKPDEMADYMMNTMHRGVTAVEICGLVHQEGEERAPHRGTQVSDA